jgi:hypothetical protein
MDKVCCMLIDLSLTFKVSPYAADYAVLIYTRLPDSALDNHKSPNGAYGDSSDFSNLYVFGSIYYALQPSKLLHKLEERPPKGIFPGIDPLTLLEHGAVYLDGPKRILAIQLLDEKPSAVVRYTRLRRMGMELSTASIITWWQKT